MNLAYSILLANHKAALNFARGLRTTALVAALSICVELCVAGLLRFGSTSDMLWLLLLASHSSLAAADSVVTCPPQWLPVLLASSSRHVDSHAPRFNDENLLLKATVDGAAHV